MLGWRSKYIAWYIIRCDEFFLRALGENAQRLVFQESTKYGLYIASAVWPTLYTYIFSRQWRVLIRVGSVAWRTLNRFDALILFLHQVHGDESGSSTANDDKRRHSNNDCHYRGGFRCQGVRNFYKKIEKQRLSECVVMQILIYNLPLLISTWHLRISRSLPWHIFWSGVGMRHFRVRTFSSSVLQADHSLHSPQPRNAEIVSNPTLMKFSFQSSKSLTIAARHLTGIILSTLSFAVISEDHVARHR